MTRNNTPFVIMLQEPGVVVLSVIRNSLSLFLDDALCPSDGLSLREGDRGGITPSAAGLP